MINFQLIEAYDVDIENFTYNVSDMVNSIYVGPQGELLEIIERFNHQYGAKIGVTKNFTLKPGGYDEIKQAYNRWVLRYDMKPRGIRSVFDRIQQYEWRSGGFKQQILGIEDQMKRLKAGGMRWQDNTDQFVVEFDRLKASIISSLEATREMYPDISITTKVIPVSQVVNYRHRHGSSDRSCFPNNLFTEDPTDFVIMFYIKIPNANMTVHVMDEDEVMTQYTLPMDDLIIASGTYLLPMISRHWGRTAPLDGNPSNVLRYFLEALYLSETCKSTHPYIGRPTDSHYFNLGGEVNSQNICTGNMGSDIRKSLLNNEIMAHIVQLITWVTNYYVPQTYPLNRINMMRQYGDDINFVQWRNDLNGTSATVFTSQVGDGNMEGCSYPTSIHNAAYNYARGSCDGYSRDNFLPMSEEYSLRMIEYANVVNVDNMPCNNCSFKSECEKWAALQMMYADDKTCEEEGFLGMVYELWDYTVNIRNRDRSESYRDILFIEMSLKAIQTYSIVQSYETLMQTHIMAKWWFCTDGSTFRSHGALYRTRMRELNNMSPTNRDHLYLTEVGNKDSEFGWCSDTVRGHRATSDETVEETESFDEAEAWLHEEEPMPFSTPNREDLVIEEENMTPEQRAIQWAIGRGGAQNL